MSSSEMSSDEEFHKEVQGGLTKPSKIGNLGKNDYIVIKGYPCKIIEVTKSKPGKHGHAKANVTAVDIFTGKKYETSESTGHNVDCPIVEKQEFDLVNIEDDGRVYYLEEDGSTSEDIVIDPSSDLFKEIYEELHTNGNDLLVSVVSAMGKKAVVSYRKDNK